jgi:hypothetical protein
MRKSARRLSLSQATIIFKFRCIEALREVFRRDLGCTVDEAKAHAGKFDINVKSAVYEMEDQLRSVTCEVTVYSFNTTGYIEPLTLYFECYLRARSDHGEFFAVMHSKLGPQAPKELMFNASYRDLHEYRFQNWIEIEDHEWGMTQATMTAIERTHFEGFLPEKMDKMKIMKLLLTSVGIDGRAGSVESSNSAWVRHNSLLTCGMPDESGYETDDIEKKIAEHCAREGVELGGSSSDDDSDEPAAKRPTGACVIA